MPTPTYTPLANITLGSATATVTFSSITAYRDYVLVFNGQTSASANILMRINSDSGANYNILNAYGDGSSTGSSSIGGNGASYVPFDYNWTANTQFTFTHQIMDASATDKHKTILTRWGQASVAVAMMATRWASTSAVTSLTITTSTGDMNAGTSIALYGIAA